MNLINHVLIVVESKNIVINRHKCLHVHFVVHVSLSISEFVKLTNHSEAQKFYTFATDQCIMDTRNATCTGGGEQTQRFRLKWLLCLINPFL